MTDTNAEGAPEPRMFVTIQITPDAPADIAQQLMKAAGSYGASLRLMVPDTHDPALARYFTLEVPDAAEAARASALLRQHAAVAAAYVKPADALP